MLKMRSAGPLWNRKATPPAEINFIGFDIPLEEVNRFKDADGDWVHVKAHFPLSPAPVEGDVLAADVVADTGSLNPFNIWAFTKYCTLAARMVNSEKGANEYGVSRDYLIALALVLNDVQQLPLTKEQIEKFDPFHFSEEEWEAFRKQGQNATDYFPADRLDSLAQVDAAAAFAFQSTKEISDGLTKAGTGSGPYIPNTVDLFLAHMIGPKAAIEALKKVQDTGNKGGDTTLADVVGPNFGALKTRYPAFLGIATAASISAVLDLIEARFDAAYKLVASLLTDYTPEDLPDVPPGGGEPPWFTAAKKELGTKEPDQRILEYFKAIKFSTNTTKTPWCAAFIGFCMKSSGNQAVADSVPTAGPALAATWRKWGEPLPIASDQLPVGAVVVLSPAEPADSSGHVSFFVRKEGSNVVLLGGNQSDSVKESTYKQSKIVAVRWMNVGDGSATGTGGGTQSGGTAPVVTGPVKLGPLTNADWAKFCDVLGKRESNNTYATVNKLGFCGRWQFGALALIDVGFVNPKSRTNSSLSQSGAWTGKSGVSSRDQWLSGKTAQDAAMLDYTQMHYRSLLKLGGVSPASSIAKVAGLLAAAHLMGVGGAMKLVRGTTTKDAFGTSTESYYELLSKAFGGSGSIKQDA